MTGTDIVEIRLRVDSASYNQLGRLIVKTVQWNN